jgi:hypothetical protein
MTKPTGDELETLLRANAEGMYPSEAAAEFLIRTNFWLRRGDFLRECIGYVGPTPEEPRMNEVAWVKWKEIGEALAAYADEDSKEPLPSWLGVCSGGERRLIMIAHDLARGPMSEASGLGRATQTILLAAVAHAGGSQEHHPDPFVRHPDGSVTFAEDRREYLGTLYPWPEEPFVKAESPVKK